MTNEKQNSPWGRKQRASLRGMRALLLLTLLPLTSCLSRKEVQAELWEQSGIPVELCDKMPELNQYGIYRKLDSGKVEFLSYCKTVQDENGKMIPAVQNYLSVSTKKFNEFLNQLLPEVKDVTK